MSDEGFITNIWFQFFFIRIALGKSGNEWVMHCFQILHVILTLWVNITCKIVLVCLTILWDWRLKGYANLSKLTRQSLTHLFLDVPKAFLMKKTSKNLWFSDDIRENGSKLFCSNLVNIRSKIWRKSFREKTLFAVVFRGNRSELILLNFK